MPAPVAWEGIKAKQPGARPPRRRLVEMRQGMSASGPIRPPSPPLLPFPYPVRPAITVEPHVSFTEAEARARRPEARAQAFSRPPIQRCPVPRRFMLQS